jgi:hypothetical protein
VDGKAVFDPDYTRSVLRTVLNTMNNEFDHQCLEDAVRLLNAHPICRSTDDNVPDHKDSTRGLPRTKFLVHHVRATWLIRRRWVSDDDMPGALVAEEMGFEKTFTSVAAATMYKLLTEKVVMGLPLSTWWGNTHSV